MLNMNIEVKELKNGEYKATTHVDKTEVNGFGENLTECLKDVAYWIEAVKMENEKEATEANKRATKAWANILV